MSLHHETIRQIVTSHHGGQSVRIRLSNTFGSRPVEIGAASIGLSAGEAALRDDTARVLTFDGATKVTVSPGQSVHSDPTSLAIESMDRLAVSVFVQNRIGCASRHFTANEFVWTAPGDQTQSPRGQAFKPQQSPLKASTLLLDRLEVWPSTSTVTPRRVVATFGDSLTDGYMCEPRRPLLPGSLSIGADVRYPDFLQRRADANGVPVAFFSAAISGNRLLSGPWLPSFGPSGASRLHRDVISAAGVTDAIILIGSNDLGFARRPAATAQALRQGLSQAIRALRAAGIGTILGTLPPMGGASFGLLHGRRTVEAARQDLNDWIRSSGTTDRVVDFDACLRDPEAPHRMRVVCDGGDHLHPNARGYAAMAEEVDLSWFESS